MSTANEAQLSSTTTSSSDDTSSSELESNTHCTDDSSDTDSDQGAAADTPLYDGSTLSAKNFNGMFSALMQKHNLSSQATDSILKLIKLSLPKGNKCPSSGYQFEKSLLDLGYNYTKHITCWRCQHPLRERDICPNNQCCNVGRQGKGEDSSIFYVIDLLPEIERIISGKTDFDF